MKKMLVLVVALTAILLASPAVAQGPELVIDPAGKIVSDGRAARLTVTSSCPAGEDVLEAFIYVTQDGNQSAFTPLRVVCDGDQHTRRVRVEAEGFAFHPGTAHASGYLLVTPGQSTSPGQEIQLD